MNELTRRSMAAERKQQVIRSRDTSHTEEERAIAAGRVKEIDEYLRLHLHGETSDSE